MVEGGCGQGVDVRVEVLILFDAGVEDAGLRDGVRGGWGGLWNNRLGELAVGLDEAEDGAVARRKPGNGGYSSGRGYTGGEGFAVLGGLDERGAACDGSAPALANAVMAVDLLVVGVGVDDVSEVLSGDRLRGGVGPRDDDVVVAGLDGTGFDPDASDRDVLAQNGKAAAGAQLLDFAQGDGYLAGHVAVEDDRVSDAALKLAGELVAVGKDEDVGLWLGGGSGLGDGSRRHEGAQSERQGDEAGSG